MRAELSLVPADRDDLLRLLYGRWWTRCNLAREADKDIRPCPDDHDYGKPKRSQIDCL